MPARSRTKTATIRRVYAPRSRGITGALADAVVRLLLPSPCLGCQVPLPAARQPLGLCPDCRGGLVRTPQTGCRVCGTVLWSNPPPSDGRCPACRVDPPAFDRLLAAWSYEAPLDAVIQGLKFHRLEYLGSHLATSVMDALGSTLEGHDVVVPVPLHWRRFWARGYNQAEVIARPLAKGLGLPLELALRRRRATRPQSGLARRHRTENVRRAFVHRRRRPVAGKRILLVDDVTTTTATLDEAARCLKSAGGRAVTALAVGRTGEG